MFNAGHERFNLQLQMHKSCFDIINIKRWILIFEMIEIRKRYFKYQTKTGSRWQQVTVDSEAVVIFGEKIALFV